MYHPDPDRPDSHMIQNGWMCSLCGYEHPYYMNTCPTIKLDTEGNMVEKTTEMNSPTKVEYVNKPVADGGGLRYNAGKNQLELLPPEWIWGLGMVMSRGAIKYDVRNWERGMKWSYPVGCALRHIYKFVCGERYDAETGCHHLAMAAWNILALMTYDVRNIGSNDLVGDLKYIEAVSVPPGPALQKIIDDKANNGKPA